jgi:hypothetical protein
MAFSGALLFKKLIVTRLSNFLETGGSLPDPQQPVTQLYLEQLLILSSEALVTDVSHEMQT